MKLVLQLWLMTIAEEIYFYKNWCKGKITFSFIVIALFLIQLNLRPTLSSSILNLTFCQATQCVVWKKKLIDILIMNKLQMQKPLFVELNQ